MHIVDVVKQKTHVSNAYSMLPKTKKIVALCSLANFINAADRIVMPIAIIPMTDHYNWSLYWQGWILSAFAFGYITSQVCLSFCFNMNACVLMLYTLNDL